jgi:hypothetical protein
MVMTEHEFIDYYVANSAELTSRKEIPYDRKKEIILELFRPGKCGCGADDCKGWLMQPRAATGGEFIQQLVEIQKREGLL